MLYTISVLVGLKCSCMILYVWHFIDLDNLLLWFSIYSIVNVFLPRRALYGHVSFSRVFDVLNRFVGSCNDLKRYCPFSKSIEQSCIVLYYLLQPWFVVLTYWYLQKQCAADSTHNLLISVPPHFAQIWIRMQTYQGVCPALQPPTILHTERVS